MEDKEICKKCGGSCCLHYPGLYHGDDFNTIEEVKELLKTGKVCIDYWEDGFSKSVRDAYFVRPSIQGREGIIFEPGFGGPCAFLTDTGCELSHDDRPRQCRNLVPSEDHNCQFNDRDKRFKSMKRQYISSWLKFNDDLKKIADGGWS